MHETRAARSGSVLPFSCGSHLDSNPKLQTRNKAKTKQSKTRQGEAALAAMGLGSGGALPGPKASRFRKPGRIAVAPGPKSDLRSLLHLGQACQAGALTCRQRPWALSRDPKKSAGRDYSPASDVAARSVATLSGTALSTSQPSTKATTKPTQYPMSPPPRAFATGPS